jgi:hypothetical protein
MCTKTFFSIFVVRRREEVDKQKSFERSAANVSSQESQGEANPNSELRDSSLRFLESPG